MVQEGNFISVANEAGEELFKNPIASTLSGGAARTKHSPEMVVATPTFQANRTIHVSRPGRSNVFIMRDAPSEQEQLQPASYGSRPEELPPASQVFLQTLIY
jgi:hypothetical protein